jgi:hypothetical protein
LQKIEAREVNMNNSDPVQLLFEKAKLDPAFYRDLAEDPDRVLALMADDAAGKEPAVKRIDPKKRTRVTKSAARRVGGGAVGGGANVFCFDVTCGDSSCQYTCGARSCGFTCSISCTGDTCTDSCGHTSGIALERKPS